MIAYKGFNKDLRSTYGNGKDKDCNFTPREKKDLEKDKVVTKNDRQ